MRRPELTKSSARLPQSENRLEKSCPVFPKHGRDTALYDRYARMTEGVDVVVGSIADDRMFYVLDNFFLGNITDQALTKSLSAMQQGAKPKDLSDGARKSHEAQLRGFPHAASRDRDRGPHRDRQSKTRNLCFPEKTGC